MHKDTIHVLLADDDEDDRNFFKDAFGEIKINTDVKLVKDGVELMEYLNKPDIVLPHILFLDLNMPRKNGMECLREIKKIDRFKHIAIAIYSTSASDSDIEETFVKGANIHIKKPNDFEALKKTLSVVTTLNWQYHTNSLNKETFLLSI